MVYKRTITRFFADNKVVYKRVRQRIMIGFRQQLSMVSFEAFELEISDSPRIRDLQLVCFIIIIIIIIMCFKRCHALVHTCMGNASFTRNLTS